MQCAMGHVRDFPWRVYATDRQQDWLSVSTFDTSCPLDRAQAAAITLRVCSIFGRHAAKLIDLDPRDCEAALICFPGMAVAAQMALELCEQATRCILDEDTYRAELEDQAEPRWEMFDFGRRLSILNDAGADCALALSIELPSLMPLPVLERIAA
jgi:hypothetical protein